MLLYESINRTGNKASHQAQCIVGNIISHSVHSSRTTEASEQATSMLQVSDTIKQS